MPVSDKKLNEVDAVQNVKDRPHWDIYYLTMAYIVAQRSFDASSRLSSSFSRLTNIGNTISGKYA